MNGDTHLDELIAQEIAQDLARRDAPQPVVLVSARERYAAALAVIQIEYTRKEEG